MCLKKTLDIIDCNLTNDHQILIIFGTNISDTTIKRPLQFPPHPTRVSALPQEVGTHKIGLETNTKCQKHLWRYTVLMLSESEDAERVSTRATVAQRLCNSCTCIDTL